MKQYFKMLKTCYVVAVYPGDIFSITMALIIKHLQTSKYTLNFIHIQDKGSMTPVKI